MIQYKIKKNYLIPGLHYQDVVRELPFNIPTFKLCVEILTIIC